MAIRGVAGPYGQLDRRPASLAARKGFKPSYQIKMGKEAKSENLAF